MSDAPTPSNDDYHKIFGAILTNLAREDSNTGQRVGWAISLSGGMFTAIAFMAPRINDFCGDGFGASMICAAIAGVAAMALFFSLRALRGVRAAHEQIDYLKKQYERLKATFDRMSLPRPYGDSNTPGLWGIQSAAIFPRVLMAFWAVILVLALLASALTLAQALRHPGGLGCTATGALASASR